MGDTGNVQASEIDLGTLLARPPGDITRWVSDQIQKLGEADVQVEDQPIFKIATALKDAPLEQKQALVSGVLQGVQDLPLETRSDAVKQLLNAAKESQGDEETGDGTPLQEAPSPTLKNLMRVVSESGLQDMEKEELDSIVEIGKDPRLIKPLVEVVPELDEEDRKIFTTALVKSKTVSEDKVDMIEKAVTPGGPVDQVAKILRLVAWAQAHAWVGIAVPLVELVLSFAVPHCNSLLKCWLASDALLGLGKVGLTYATVSALIPAYNKFSEDPLGFVADTKAAADEGGDWTMGIPGLKQAVSRAGCLVAFIILSSAWTLVGVVFCLMSLSCPVPVLLITVAFVVLRVGILYAMGKSILSVKRDIDELRSPREDVGLSADKESLGYGACSTPEPPKAETTSEHTGTAEQSETA